LAKVEVRNAEVHVARGLGLVGMVVLVLVLLVRRRGVVRLVRRVGNRACGVVMSAYGRGWLDCTDGMVGDRRSDGDREDIPRGTSVRRSGFEMVGG
jgi:hypothetical protein